MLAKHCIIAEMNIVLKSEHSSFTKANMLALEKNKSIQT